MMSNFKESFTDQPSFRRGRAGEVNVIEQLLDRQIPIREYTDFKKHQEKQFKGYDLEILNEKTSEWDRADIKTNIRNGFTYLEVRKHPSPTKLGWLYSSSADCILTYDLENNHCYKYSLKEMRNYVEKRKDKWKLCGRNKDCYAIPVDKNPIIEQIF